MQKEQLQVKGSDVAVFNKPSAKERMTATDDRALLEARRRAICTAISALEEYARLSIGDSDLVRLPAELIKAGQLGETAADRWVYWSTCLVPAG
jgi:hypothetical protein